MLPPPFAFALAGASVLRTSVLDEHRLRLELANVLAEEARALDPNPAPPPGAFSRDDVRNAAREAGVATGSGWAQFEVAIERLGASNLDATQFAWAIRDAKREPFLDPETIDDRLGKLGAW